jgi:phospholipid-binding lipoprotein MlaA
MNNKGQNGLGYFAPFLLISIFLAIFSISSYAETTTAQTKQLNAQPTPSQTTTKADTTPTDDSSLDATYNDVEETNYNKDPLEKFNRAMFTFNDKLDIYLFKPVAELYNAIVPIPLNQGIHNFFNNLGEVPTIINDLLQFNFYQMSKDVARLGINSTMGIGGLFDMATRMNLPYFQNDFGLTLASWGYKNSNYLVLPFLGSNTIRDGLIAMPVDYLEFTVYPYVEPQSTRFQLLALFMVDHRANLLQFEPVLEEAAIDKYVFMRNAYMQHRAFQIEQLKHLGYKDRNYNAPSGEITT